jgi:hypothetical protein
MQKQSSKNMRLIKSSAYDKGVRAAQNGKPRFQMFSLYSEGEHPWFSEELNQTH